MWLFVTLRALTKSPANLKNKPNQNPLIMENMCVLRRGFYLDAAVNYNLQHSAQETAL